MFTAGAFLDANLRQILESMGQLGGCSLQICCLDPIVLSGKVKQMLWSHGHQCSILAIPRPAMKIE